MTTKLRRDNCFDFLRYWAAFSVMFLHFTGYAITYIDYHSLFISILRSVATFMPGVVVLFSLSGFLITGSLERSKNLKEFFIKRVVRLYPELWVCTIVNLVILIIIIPNVLDASIFTWIATQVLGIANTPACLREFATGSVNGALWTIFVEIQLYIVVALTFRFLKSFSVKKWMAFLVMLVLLNIGADLLVTHMNNSTVNKILERLFLPYALWFYIGVFCKMKFELIVPILKKWLYLIWVAYILMRYSKFGIPGYYCNAMIGVICSFLIIGIAYKYPIGRVKSDITYGVFLYHWIFLNLIVHFGLFQKISIYVLTILFISGTISAAWLSQTYVARWSKRLSQILIRKVVNS